MNLPSRMSLMPRPESPSNSRETERSGAIRESRSGWGKLLTGILLGAGALAVGSYAWVEFLSRLSMFGGH